MHVPDTYFVIAHFHYIMVGGTIMAYLGGLHYWWPKISGRLYQEGWAKPAALIIFLGFNLTFFPQFILGYLGMPRRYYMYPAEFQLLNILSTAGATILGVGYILPMIYLVWPLRYGPVADANPWPSTGLEWRTASPPPAHNFTTTPLAAWEAYDFSSLGETYGGVFLALLFLTLATYGVAFVDLRAGNMIVALTIAMGKALLVALFFMQLRYSPKLLWLVAGGGVFWLGVLFMLTLGDDLTRS